MLLNYSFWLATPALSDVVLPTFFPDRFFSLAEASGLIHSSPPPSHHPAAIPLLRTSMSPASGNGACSLSFPVPFPPSRHQDGDASPRIHPKLPRLILPNHLFIWVFRLWELFLPFFPTFPPQILFGDFWFFSFVYPRDSEMRVGRCPVHALRFFLKIWCPPISGQCLCRGFNTLSLEPRPILLLQSPSKNVDPHASVGLTSFFDLIFYLFLSGYKVCSSPVPLWLSFGPGLVLLFPPMIVFWQLFFGALPSDVVVQSTSFSPVDLEFSFFEIDGVFLSLRPVLSPAALVVGCFGSPVPFFFSETNHLFYRVSDCPRSLRRSWKELHPRLLDAVSFSSPS